MAVQVQQEQLEPCRVALTIDIPPEDYQKAVDAVFNQFARRTNVPGFRPGKAPRHLVRRFIDEERVRELALDQALNRAFQDALRQTGVTPYSEAEPEVQLPEEELDPEKGYRFTATIALQPHVHLGSVEDLSVRRLVTPVTEDDVNREIRRYQERAATYQESEEPAAEGDRVRTALQITLNGETVTDAPEEAPVLLQVGSNLDEIDTNLTGMRAGDEKAFEFVYPDDAEDESYRGQRATAQVKALAVLRLAVPEADDAFATAAGFSDVQAFRARVQEALQFQADAMADQEVNDNLIREVVRRSTVHYPQEMVEREVSGRMDGLIRTLEARSTSLDAFLGAQKTDLAELQAQFRAEAVEMLERTLVLVELARENGISVSDREVEEEVRQRAEAQNVRLSQMRRVLNETGEIGTLRNRVFYRKIAEFLRGKAEIREVEG